MGGLAAFKGHSGQGMRICLSFRHLTIRERPPSYLSSGRRRHICNKNTVSVPAYASGHQPDSLRDCFDAGMFAAFPNGDDSLTLLAG